MLIESWDARHHAALVDDKGFVCASKNECKKRKIRTDYSRTMATLNTFKGALATTKYSPSKLEDNSCKPPSASSDQQKQASVSESSRNQGSPLFFPKSGCDRRVQ